MTELHETVFDVEAKIAEIGPLDSASINVPINPKVLDRIREDDDDPQFVTLEIQSGWSKSKRNWKPEILHKIAEQVNQKQPVGYRGHIPEKDDAFAFPEPQTIWLGATTSTKGDVTCLYVKGYNISPEIRRYVKLGAVNSVSVRGDSVLRPVQGGYEVAEFDLESIDWSRKLRSGMTNKLVAVTAEMEGGNSVEPKDIAALSEDELRAHAPLLVKKIEDDAAKPLNSKIEEMEPKVEEGEESKSTLDAICEKLGIDGEGNPLERVEELLTQVNSAATETVKGFVKELVSKNVKGDNAQALVLRLVGEQFTKYEDTELDGGEIPETTKKEMEETLTGLLENDEHVKAVVSEMVTQPSTGGAHLGGRSRKPDEKKDSESEGEIVKQTERLTVTKRTM